MTNLWISPDYRMIPKEAKADHLTILVQCAILENSGVFKRAGRWLDKDFPMLCQLTRQEVDTLLAHGLAKFRKGNLVIKHYDLPGQINCEKKRKAAQKGGFSKAERYRNFLKEEERLLAYARADAKAHAIASAKANATSICHSRPRPSVPDPSPTDPPRTDFGKTPNPKSPSLKGRGLLSFSIEPLKLAWPWPETFIPEAVKRALKRVGRDRIDEIVAGMKRDTANPKWRQKNLMVRAASYIRGSQWIAEPKKSVTKNGANGSNGKTVLRSVPMHSSDEAWKKAELNEIVRDFSEAFPNESFPGPIEAREMLSKKMVRNLANRKTVGDA